MSFCNEVENDLGSDWLHKSERDLTLVALAGPFEALPQPVSVLPSQDPQPEGEGVRGVLKSLSWNRVFLSQRRSSHQSPCFI